MSPVRTPASPFRFGGFTGWRARVLAGATVELGWFALLHPLWPRNFLGFLVEAALAAPALAYALAAERLYRRVEGSLSRAQNALLGSVVTLIGIAWVGLAIYTAHHYLQAGFGLGMFHRE